MSRLETQFLILITLSCFVVVLVINYTVNRENKYLAQTNTTMQDLKRIIRYEVQQTLSQGKGVTSLTVLKKAANKSERYVDVSKKRFVPGTNARVKTVPISIKNTTSEQVDKPSSKSSTAVRKQRYIVHLCDNTHACSGWGDRQRGLVAAFLLACVTDRVFVLNMTSPCNIRTFLQPNKYNWTLPNAKLEGRSAITVGGVRSVDYHRTMQFSDVNTVYPQDVIYLRSNSDLLNVIKSNPHFKERIPTWAQTNRPQAFKNGWDILMKPTPHIVKRIDTILSGVNLSREGDLVCAHVRIGKNPSVPNDSPNRNAVESVSVLWRFLQTYVKTASRVFIATDSLEVRKLARKEFGKKALDTGGTILHIDRQRKSESACDGFETVILEQLILTKCHVLVVSASNFSIRGAFIRGKRENLFMFRNGTVTPFSMGT